MKDIEIVKEELQKLTQTYDEVILEIQSNKKRYYGYEGGVATCIPILHNEGKILLQFCGLGIWLKSDGTWDWEDAAA